MADFGSVLVSGFGSTSLQNEPKYGYQNPFPKRPLINNDGAAGDGAGYIDTQQKPAHFVSHPVKADGLVHRASGFHTLQVHTINLNGNIKIEGTLSRDPLIGPWAPVELIDTDTHQIFTDLGFTFVLPVPGVPFSGKTKEINKFYNIVGQYAYLKANISNVTLGAVESIKLSF